MKKRTKIVITTLSLAALLGVYYNVNNTYTPQYKVVGYFNSTKPYAKYSKGDVYIIKDEKLIDKLVLLDYDVVIIDEREGKNPSMKIISSSSIDDKHDRNDIIEIMQDYNTRFPSNWKRSNESLRLEWFVHNFLFNINYQLDHTTDVDLDNNDEDEFNKPFINKILKI